MVSVTKSSRTISRVLVVPVLALCFGLSACSDDTPADSGSTTTGSAPSADSTASRGLPSIASPASTTPSDAGELVGDWTIELLESAGQSVTGESVRQQEGDMTLAVRADGTFTITIDIGDGAPEQGDGTWTSSGTGAVFTVDGSGADVTLDGDRLTLTDGETTFVFVRS